VLEDNLRSPSGLAYACAVRDVLDAIMPDLPRPDGLLDPSAAIDVFRRSILGSSGVNGTAAVLTGGPASSARFEHHRLAEGAGFLLVQPGDLEVTNGRVLERATGTPVDALYLRMDGELIDLVGEDGRKVGAEIFEVASAGGVFLANAPGNGVADDKSVYCYVPDLIEFYLDERPLLESVPTYRTVDAEERAAVLDRVGELVTKPVDGDGGKGVLIGPDASAREVAERRELIAQDPERWIAQEVVPLSWHPTLVQGELVPRHVDLRTFVYAAGPDERDYEVAPVALTRMAAEGSSIVNSSRGGGAKDTWIIGNADSGKDEERVRAGG